MSGANSLLRPLGQGVPLPGGNIPTPSGPRGAPQGAQIRTNRNSPLALRGPTMPQMQAMVAQPPPMNNMGAGGPAGGLGQMPDPTAGGLSLQDQLTQHMKRAKAAFDNTGKALKQVDLIRKGLEKLGDKQDMVTMEDIIKEAGTLVSHGIDPIAMAGVLADAPQEGGGEALGGWVQSHAQTAMQAEQQLKAQHEMNGHVMAVAAMHSIMAASMGHGTPDNNVLQQDTPGNALTPAGNALSPAEHHELPGANPMEFGGRFLQR